MAFQGVETLLLAVLVYRKHSSILVGEASMHVQPVRVKMGAAFQ